MIFTQQNCFDPWASIFLFEQYSISVNSRRNYEYNQNSNHWQCKYKTDRHVNLIRKVQPRKNEFLSRFHIGQRLFRIWKVKHRHKVCWFKETNNLSVGQWSRLLDDKIARQTNCLRAASSPDSSSPACLAWMPHCQMEPIIHHFFDGNESTVESTITPEF